MESRSFGFGEGLGTRDEAEASRLVGQLNEILADQSMRNPAAKAKAGAKYEKQIVAAFYDYVELENRDGWSERELVSPIAGSRAGLRQGPVRGHNRGRKNDYRAAS